MSDALFPIAADMSTLGEWVGVFVAFGVGLSIVFWTVGYVVWFIVQLFR